MPFVVRPTFEWRLRTRTLPLGRKTLIMGILNLTPDSFSDGGRFTSHDAAQRHALQMLEAGADILDLGGESTRPGSVALSPAEEQARVLPVLQSILAARPAAVLSIDTYHAATARLAIEAGAEIVNDVSGFLWDPQMSTTCASLQCGVVLMHTRGRPHEWRTQPSLSSSEVLPLVLRELGERAVAALAAGVRHETVILDPGFGFGKRLDENYPLLAGFHTFQSLGFPLLAGVSRKSFLGRDQSAAASRGAHPDLALRTSAANVAAILAGAHILRVHDVQPAVEAAAIADRLIDCT